MSFSQEYQSVWRGQEVKIIGKKVVGKTIFEAGLIVEGNAKSLCPIDTGRLAASITTQAAGQGTDPKGKGAVSSDKIQPPTMDREVFVGTPVFYGPYQEFGTVRNEPQPFLRPALDMAKGKALTLFLYNGRVQFKDYVRVA